MGIATGVSQLLLNIEAPSLFYQKCLSKYSLHLKKEKKTLKNDFPTKDFISCSPCINSKHILHGSVFVVL